ncbi:MAG: hypothetical protein ACI9S8_000920 [Chlamydiales bacterium]|jgi:hypothetical protein
MTEFNISSSPSERNPMLSHSSEVDAKAFETKEARGVALRINDLQIMMQQIIGSVSTDSESINALGRAIGDLQDDIDVICKRLSNFPLERKEDTIKAISEQLKVAKNSVISAFRINGISIQGLPFAKDMPKKIYFSRESEVAGSIPLNVETKPDNSDAYSKKLGLARYRVGGPRLMHQTRVGQALQNAELPIKHEYLDPMTSSKKLCKVGILYHADKELGEALASGCVNNLDQLENCICLALDNIFEEFTENKISSDLPKREREAMEQSQKDRIRQFLDSSIEKHTQKLYDGVPGKYELPLGSRPNLEERAVFYASSVKSLMQKQSFTDEFMKHLTEEVFHNLSNRSEEAPPEEPLHGNQGWESTARNLASWVFSNIILE